MYACFTSSLDIRERYRTKIRVQKREYCSRLFHDEVIDLVIGCGSVVETSSDGFVRHDEPPPPPPLPTIIIITIIIIGGLRRVVTYSYCPTLFHIATCRPTPPTRPSWIRRIKTRVPRPAGEQQQQQAAPRQDPSTRTCRRRCDRSINIRIHPIPTSPSRR